MSKLFWSSVEAIVALIALTLVSIAFAYLWPDNEYGLTAWVQAFGSIAAIVAAFMVANNQVQAQRKVEVANANDDARRKIRTLRSLLAHLKEYLELAAVMRVTSLTGKTGAETVSALLSLHTLLERLPIFEVPLDELIIEFHHIQRFVPILCMHFELERTLTHPQDAAKRAYHEWEARQMLPGLVSRTANVIELCDVELAKLA